jgi:hypothetical protein
VTDQLGDNHMLSNKQVYMRVLYVNVCLNIHICVCVLCEHICIYIYVCVCVCVRVCRLREGQTIDEKGGHLKFKFGNEDEEGTCVCVCVCV